ncbi:predicted protein [Thalassiosira pseudonana CCMP1335]|uniref:Plastid lipid-associated protein/fibrillin conserved domain-containing protein n=1 Tax=Thalassiosira pseudonana TaxID=35128 RepID=B8BQA8_THAPS|nr:predicted protein [Thalassiosira pseudonana CCMP1335]EED96333.1 predicted protein [Thalassiosira pseudonana CCMP1335]
MQQFASFLLCILAAGDVASFSPSTTFTTRPTISTDAAYASSKHYNTNLFSMPDDPYPSDYDVEDLSTEKKVSVDIDEDDAIIRDELKRELLLLSSVTNRGQCASQEEENLVVDLVTQLEALNPTADPALNSQGDWELCYSSTQSFRSSPFFLAIRSFMGESNKSMAENAFDIHDRATTASRVGKVRQIVDAGNMELISEYELSVGLLPGLPVRVKGTVITSADMRAIAPETWELTVKATKVKGSNVPFFDQYLDDSGLELPVGEAYKAISGSVPVSVLKTFYVDEGMRISRDVDDNFFVFTRA